MTDTIRVAIVGGGAGGLAAANFLLRSGLDVTVYEQASRLGEVGAGVQIAPNGLRMLDRVGLGDSVRERGARLMPGSAYFRKEGGEPVAAVHTTDSSGELSLYGLHRADLISILSDPLAEGVVRTGQRATRVEQGTQGVRIHFDNGEEAVADVLIGADGIHSTIRAQVVEPAAPVHSGSLAYRGLLDSSVLPEWPHDRSQFWMGDGKHFLVFPVRQGRMLNYVGFVPTDEAVKESWSATGDPDRLRASFVGWDPRVEELLSKVETCFWWGLYDREPLPHWGEGRITLLGDAAHAMLPHLGQGVNQAIEDGAALGTFLAGAAREDVPRMLEAYGTLRRERTSRVQVGSRQNGKRYDSQYADLGERDSEIVASGSLRLWLYDHDAESAAREALAAL